jgi:hypothetical protein
MSPPLPFPLYVRTLDLRAYEALARALAPGAHRHTLTPAALPDIEAVLATPAPATRVRYDLHDLLVTEGPRLRAVQADLRASGAARLSPDHWGSVVQVLVAGRAMPGYQSWPYDLSAPLSPELVVLGELDGGLGQHLWSSGATRELWLRPPFPRGPLALGNDLRVVQGDLQVDLAELLAASTAPGAALPAPMAAAGGRLGALVAAAQRRDLAVALSDL